MEIDHKDTKHTKVKTRALQFSSVCSHCFRFFPSLCLRAFVVNLSPLSEEAIERV